MIDIQFRIPNDAALEEAIKVFVQAEFNQSAEFKAEETPDVAHKDGGLVDAAWQIVIVLATVEGSLQFAERIKRMERVKQLLAAIKAAGKSVHMKIGQQQSVDLSKESVDETMNLLAKTKDDESQSLSSSE